jgi:hypothetical protein
MEVGTAVGTEADKLAVEQHVMAVEGDGDGRNLGELVTAVPAWARTKAPAAVARDAQLGAHAVPLELKRPLIPRTGWRQPRPQQHGSETIGKRFSGRRPWHRPTLRSAACADPADLALCVERARDLLPVRAERYLQRLHDSAAQHAVPRVAFEREHGGDASANGDRRVVLYGQGRHEPIEQLGFIRKSQREASTVHEPAP